MEAGQPMKYISGEEERELLQDGPDHQKQRKASKWSAEQNFEYADFLEQNIHEFDQGRHRRSAKFFIKMAHFLRNGKNNEQCRSHHQKMMKRYGNVNKIIKRLSRPEKGFRDLKVVPYPTFEDLVLENLSQYRTDPVSEVELILVDDETDFFGRGEDSWFLDAGVPFLY